MWCLGIVAWFLWTTLFTPGEVVNVWFVFVFIVIYVFICDVVMSVHVHWSVSW